jgi:hypothetical protein
MIPRHCWVVTIALLLAGLPAAAGKEEEAREHFMRGAVKYTEGNIDAALAEFQLAYALNPSFKIRYNVAQCHMEQERWDRAYEEFYLFLYEGGDEVDPERRVEVEQSLSDLAQRLGEDVPDPAELQAKAATAEEPAPEPAAPAPQQPVVWTPDPRAADMSLETRPEDMPLRDWFGVGERQMRYFERARGERPELGLDDYLVERGRESQGLFLGEILSGAGAVVGGGMALGGYIGGNDDLTQVGLLVAVAGVIAVGAQLIVDVIDVGYPRVNYPQRLDAEIAAREAAEDAADEPAVEPE